MQPIVLTKYALSAVATLGVGKVVGDIITNNTVVTTTAQKVLVKAGSFFISAMMVENACAFVSNKVDEVVEAYQEHNEDKLTDEAVDAVVEAHQGRDDVKLTDEAVVEILPTEPDPRLTT